MDSGFIVDLALGKPVTDEALAYHLYEICDREHASCNSDCPVYELNGNKAPDTAHDFSKNLGCDCFKSGKAMLEFVRKHGG